MTRPDTICALATPRGEGAVGMVRVSGPAALDLLRAVSRQQAITARAMCATTLRHPHGGQVVDQVLVCAMPAPRSYTGEDVVEVHGHGGELNMARILGLFLELGARLAEPGEFTRRAFLNGKMDLTRAEAVAQVIAARSEQAMRNAQATLAGELGQRVGQIRQLLLALAAQLEVSIDFADEVDRPLAQQAASLHQQATDLTRELAGTYRRGQQLDGVTVALVGPANAGKSTLFNALLGGPRALVDSQPGTTRDYLEAELSWSGRRVTLVDTAGQRDPGQATTLEAAGQALVEPLLQRCDLLVWVLDLAADRPQQQLAAAACQRSSGRPLLVVANKQDIAPDRALDQLRRGPGQLELVAISALGGQGLEQLRHAMEQILDPGGEELAETVLVTRQRQHAALQRTLSALDQGQQAQDQGLPPEVVVEHYREALSALGEITGETHSDAVLDAVFNTFCIGK